MTVTGLYLKLTLAFFFLMLVIPTTFRLERGALLAVLTLGVAVAMLRNRWAISKTVFLWTLVMATAGLMFMWHGAVLGAPGALRLGTVHFVWPVLYMLFIGLLEEPGTLVYFQKTIVLAALVAALMGLTLVVGSLVGYGPMVSNFLASQEGIVAFYDGFVRYRLTNIPTLIYGAGFFLAYLSLPLAQRSNWRGWSWILWVTLLPMLVAIILSGRRAAWLVVLLMPAIILGLMLASRQPIRARPWVMLLVIAVGLFLGIREYFDLEMSSLIREFWNAFDFSAEQSASVRVQQGDALIQGWIEKPIIGHGLGAGAGVVRAIEEPWAYELVYAALLFQAGLIGVVLYAVGIAWVFIAGTRIVRQIPESASIMLPLLAGLAGFLIANATNPYLSKFDYLWALFLPVAAINVYIRRRAGPHGLPATVAV